MTEIKIIQIVEKQKRFNFRNQKRIHGGAHHKMLTEKLCLSLGFKCEINVDNPQHSWSQALKKKNRKKRKTITLTTS